MENTAANSKESEIGPPDRPADRFKSSGKIIDCDWRYNGIFPLVLWHASDRLHKCCKELHPAASDELRFSLAVGSSVEREIDRPVPMGD